MRVLITINGDTSVYSSKALEWLTYEITHLWKCIEHETSGKCVVDYGKGYKNEFEFDDFDDFYHKFKPCIEPELLKELKKG